ncbi:MAG: YqaE/Pmp3 family membrane protein [Sedimenticola sp.]
MNILNLILAILLPPLGAFLQVGASKHLIINLLLCLLGWVPGILHAVWLVATDQKG